MSSKLLSQVKDAYRTNSTRENGRVKVKINNKWGKRVLLFFFVENCSWQTFISTFGNFSFQSYELLVHLSPQKFQPLCFLKSMVCFYGKLCTLEFPSDHCAESVKYGVISGPYFSAFGLNTERYEGSLRVQSKCRKIRTRSNSLFAHISRSEILQRSQPGLCKSIHD